MGIYSGIKYLTKGIMGLEQSGTPGRVQLSGEGVVKKACMLYNLFQSRGLGGTTGGRMGREEGTGSVLQDLGTAFAGRDCMAKNMDPKPRFPASDPTGAIPCHGSWGRWFTL